MTTWAMIGRELVKCIGPPSTRNVFLCKLNFYTRRYCQKNLCFPDVEKLLTNIQMEREKGKRRGYVQRQELFTIQELFQYLKEENGKEICVIQVPPTLQYVSYFVTCIGNSSRHIKQMAENLCYQVRQKKTITK